MSTWAIGDKVKMALNINLLLSGAVGLLLYLSVALLWGRVTYAVNARRLGTKPFPAYPQPFWDVLGLQMLRRVLKASQEKVVPMHIHQRQADLKKLLSRTVHTYSTKVLGETVIVTNDPINIQSMLAKQFKDFSLARNRRGNFSPLLGNGIFTSDGKAWEHSRAMLRPAFARDQISDLELEERHIKNLMRALPIAADGWTQETDIQILFFRLTIDSSTEFLFGESVDSQINELPENATFRGVVAGPRTEQSFAHAFDTAQLYLSRRARLGPYYYLIDNTDFRRACRRCHEFIDHYVNLAIESQVKTLKSEKHELKIREKYVFLKELAHQTQDPIELRSQLLHILLAGRDTTASLLGWTFYLLARHPQQYEKLRQSVIETFGAFECSPEAITFSTLKGCQYLQFVLNESLRLFPPVPLNARTSVVDTTLPKGGGPDGESPIFVPKRTTVGYSVYSMHRTPEFWGTSCDEFIPERWTDRKPGWDFLPFNGGNRICIGQQFALTSAGYVIVRLLQRFDAIENLDTTEMRQNATLTSCSDAGVRIRLHQAC